jgi:fluoride ion exporter CrcB/FEX
LTLTWKNIGLVFAGGAIGTLLRFGTSSNLDDLTALAIVNIVGSAIIGWLNSDPRFASDGKRAFWAVGFTGGFTSMSGVALLQASGVIMLIQGARSVADIFSTGPMVFYGLIVAIFAASLLAYWGAHALTSRLTGNDAVVSHEVEEVTE